MLKHFYLGGKNFINKNYLFHAKFFEESSTLYNAILRIARNFLETRVNIKISTHPFYHINLGWFSWEWSKKKKNCFILMKISPNLHGRMDGLKFWCFPWFPENSLLCVILRYTVYLKTLIAFLWGKLLQKLLRFVLMHIMNYVSHSQIYPITLSQKAMTSKYQSPYFCHNLLLFLMAGLDLRLNCPMKEIKSYT